MSILLTNDDGIEAPGLAALTSIIAKMDEIVVAAPHEEQSGASHRVTDQTPIALDKLDETRYAVEGSPADCARIGLLHLALDARWLLSGINAGGNLGSDIYVSGTVAAAREASLLGVPSMALSQYRHSRQRPIDWERTAIWAERVVEILLSKPLGRGEFWNVNFPDPELTSATPEIVFCPIDPGHHAVQYEQVDAGFVYRGSYQERHREPECDVDVCFSGNIAVSRISGRFILTEYPS